MIRTFTASRVSKGNVIFPPTITFDDNGLTVRCPFVFSGKSTYIPYPSVSSVHIDTPIIGFSTISFYAFGNQVSIHGFWESEVKEMQRIIAEYTK